MQLLYTYNLQASALKTFRTFGCEDYLSPNNTHRESLIHYAILYTHTYSRQSELSLRPIPKYERYLQFLCTSDIIPLYYYYYLYIYLALPRHVSPNVITPIAIYPTSVKQFLMPLW